MSGEHEGCASVARREASTLRHDGAMTTVAFIGLGAIGSRMAGRLVDAGHQVVVWNRTVPRNVSKRFMESPPRGGDLDS